MRQHLLQPIPLLRVYSPFGVVLEGRSWSVGSGYRYGFQAQEEDAELWEGAVNYKYRVEDPRLGRFFSVDNCFREFSGDSPYMSFRNGSIRYLDVEGNKWVNYYDQFVALKKEEVLKNPNSKKLQRELRRLEIKQSAVNTAIQELKTNDQALYYYIENLQVSNASTGECVDVNVEVKLGDSGSRPQTPWGGEPDATTEYSNRKKSGKVVYIEFQSTENLFPITPGPINPNTDEIGFLINLYGTTPTGRDASLANEAGDVMYRIEYPDAALRGGVESEESKYRSGGAGGYSFDVEDLYKGRKASGEGKSIASNPYPLLIE
jgi:RHS repeat-associated protein